MSEVTTALLIWLPLGTVVPFLLSRFTGADWRGALVEASIFATLGVLIFPITLALIIASVTTQPNVDLVLAISYVLALGCVLLFRRHSNRDNARVR